MKITNTIRKERKIVVKEQVHVTIQMTNGLKFTVRVRTNDNRLDGWNGLTSTDADLLRMLSLQETLEISKLLKKKLLES